MGDEPTPAPEPTPTPAAPQPPEFDLPAAFATMQEQFASAMTEMTGILGEVRSAIADPGPTPTPAPSPTPTPSPEPPPAKRKDGRNGLQRWFFGDLRW